MCLNLTGLDYLRIYLPIELVGFTELDKNIILYLMNRGISPTEISFYSGKSIKEVNILIND